MRGRIPLGIALVAALLTLASLSALALGTTVLLSFDLKLVQNRQEQAVARIRSLSNLSLALLALEEASSAGEFPEVAPPLPGLVEYRRLEPRSALVRVEGAEGSGHGLSSARVEMRSADEGWRLHIVDRR